MNRKERGAVQIPEAANDNDTCLVDEFQVSCHLPENMGIISGEVELVARYWEEIFPAIANENYRDK